MSAETLPPGEVQPDDGRFMVTKFHNKGPNTTHYYATEADAEFAAEAHHRIYHLRALVAKVPRHD